MGKKILLVTVIILSALLTGCGEKSKLTRENANLTSENNELQQQLEEAKQQLATASEQVESLTKENEELQKKVENNESNSNNSQTNVVSESEFLKIIFWSDGKTYYVKDEAFVWFSDNFCSQQKGSGEKIIITSPCYYEVELSNGNTAYVAYSNGELVWSTKRPSLREIEEHS